MLLWDYEMTDQGAVLNAMSPLQRLRICTSAMRWTLTVDPDFDSEMTPSTRDLVTRLLVACEEATGLGATVPTMPPNIEEEVHVVLEEDFTLGAAPLVMGAVTCFDHSPDGMSAEDVRVSLSYFYQAVLERQQIDVITPDAERSNAACVNAIQVQKDLIRSAS